jgi:hypothetical protein
MRTLDFALPVVLVAGIGCSAPVVTSAEADAEASSTTAAVVLIERTVSPGESARAEAVARFVRMHGGAVDDEVLRMVGAAIDFPAMGTCAPLLAARAPEPENGALQAVELVDLGTIAVEANGAKVSLQARRLPDIVDLVSGVVYSSRAPAPEALPADTAYVLRASGRPDLDVVPFAASAIAPSEPGELVVAGQDARTPGGLVLAPDMPADLSWGAGSLEDVIYVDVAQSSASGARNVRCLFDDTGRAVIAATSFTEGDGTMTIHRLHRESFQARGIDTGEIRFDFARVVSFRR